MSDPLEQIRRETSPGQAMDASENFDQASARVPEVNVDGKWDVPEQGTNIARSDDDAKLETRKRQAANNAATTPQAPRQEGK